MKRDWELVREILLRVEDLPKDRDLWVKDFTGKDPDMVIYHVHLLRQAGFLEGDRPREKVMPGDLTWEGHEFIDTIRPEPVWRRVKAYAAEKGLDLSLEVIKTTAVAVLKNALS